MGVNPVRFTLDVDDDGSWPAECHVEHRATGLPDDNGSRRERLDLLVCAHGLGTYRPKSELFEAESDLRLIFHRAIAGLGGAQIAARDENKIAFVGAVRRDPGADFVEQA